MEIGAVSMENSVEIPLKTGNKTAMTQQSYCWAYTISKPELKETHVPQCSSQHCLQQLGHGSNLDVHLQMDGKKAVLHTQWNITQL